MRRIFTLSMMVLLTFVMPHDADAQNHDWSIYLGDRNSSQYSPLEQITTENVNTLEQVWEFRTGEMGQMQCNPLVIDGTLYGTTTRSNLFALNARTGAKRWIFNPKEAGFKLSGLGASRGVVYWKEGDDRRILFSAANLLFAVNADTGKVISDFGDKGAINLRLGLGRDEQKLLVTSNTPGIVYNDLIIMGSRVNEAHPAAPGHIRAYNIRTGKQEWIFHTIPQPGEFGYDTWPPDAWEGFGGANAWGGMSLDEKREIVYVPTGSAAYDFYGGDRPGNNLFANCLIALNANTGERIWHYQFVHHDLWDRDLPAPPNLITLMHKGKQVDAVAQITKSAHVFIFDRETGKPLFDIEETPVPPSDLPGEWTSPTQPIPVRPPPFSREIFTESEVTNRTPEAHAHILERLKRYRTGVFMPPSQEGTVVLPGFDGGGEWGGASVDPNTNIMYVNNSEMAWVLTMVETSVENEDARTSQGRRVYARNCLYCHGVNLKGDPLQEYPSLFELEKRFSREESEIFIRAGKDMMPPFEHVSVTEMKALLAYLYRDEKPQKIIQKESTDKKRPREFVSTGYTRFVDQDGYPAMKPPWGSLNAIDINTGEILWKVTLGHEPGLERVNGEPSGTENYGGPVATAGGVIFIAATKDATIRAFRMETGELLWEGSLPFSGYATPAVYMVNGKQYVTVAAGGGKIGTEAGDAYVTFALPE